MTIKSTQISPGTVLSIGKNFFRVESALKVTVTRGASFIKTKLVNITTNEELEKNFKLDQMVKNVSFEEKTLEYLYPSGKDHLFLDTSTLDILTVDTAVVGEAVYYLKEGISVTSTFYEGSVFSIQLPQFLELMISKVQQESESEDTAVSNAMKTAILETGAKIEVPLFIEVGDLVKVETTTKEYIQRI